MVASEHPGSLHGCIRARTGSCGHIACLGLDPTESALPGEGPMPDRLRRWGFGLLDACKRRGILPAAIKPNIAWWEALGVSALAMLPEIVCAWRAEGVHVVLDAKRGDIGKSSAAYARAAFRTFGADSVTVAPWMGRDSVIPFLEDSAGQGAWLLLRTSNAGARDLQEKAALDGRPWRIHLAEQALEWDARGRLGMVVGATASQELEEIACWFGTARPETSFLIPGISVPGVAGGQGGDPIDVVERLRAGGLDPAGCLVNSSSGLTGAWLRNGDPSTWAEACAEALEELADRLRI